MRTLLAALVLALAFLGTASPAMADALDGDWCHSDGRRLSVQGPSFVTPAGARVTGTYNRHYASYEIPANEPGAGELASMAQLNERTMQFTVGSGESEIWTRCRAPNS